MSSIPPTSAFLDALRGDYLAGDAARIPGCGPRPTARPSTGPRSGAGRRSTSTRRRSTGSVSTSSRRSRRSAASHRPRRPASATTPRPTGPPSTSTPATRRRPRTSSSPARRRTSSARWRPRPRYFGVLPRAACEVRAVEEYKEKDAPVRLLLPAGARRVATGHLLRQRLRPAEPQVHEAGDDDLPRGGARATTSRSPSRWRTRTSTPSAGSAPGWSVAPTSRAGACTASAWPTRWACSATRRERFGMLDAQAWRAARLVVDTGLHALRWPRQRSIDFLKTAGLSETDAVIETDRYIAWPGQALTYKIGQREIERLRAELTRARRVGLRPAGVPRRGAGPRVAAAGDAQPRAARTGWPPRSEGWLSRRLRVEADPERVERPQQQSTAAPRRGRPGRGRAGPG